MRTRERECTVAGYNGTSFSLTQSAPVKKSWPCSLTEMMSPQRHPARVKSWTRVNGSTGDEVGEMTQPNENFSFQTHQRVEQVLGDFPKVERQVALTGRAFKGGNGNGRGCDKTRTRKHENLLYHSRVTVQILPGRLDRDAAEQHRDDAGAAAQDFGGEEREVAARGHRAERANARVSANAAWRRPRRATTSPSPQQEGTGRANGGPELTRW